jgi:oligopeptide transport system substrate-binding protein
MKKNRVVLWLALIVLMLTTVLAGCGSTETATEAPATEAPATEESAPAVEQVFNINIAQEPQILDPFQFRDDNATSILYALQEPLFRISKNEMGYEPGLATDYTMSADAKTFTITLRDGAKWQDGTPITAADVEYSFKRAVDPVFGSEKAFDYYTLLNAEEIVAGEKAVDELGVKALDAHTVEFRLSKPMDFFLDYLLEPSYAPIQKVAAEEFGDLYGTEPERIVSSGPYKITEWQHDAKIVLEKNENYWDAANVTLEKINITLILDANTVAGMYAVGDLDFMEVPKDFISKYKDEPGYEWRSKVGVSFIEFNPNIEYLNNIKIREALSLSFDRKAYVEKILGNGDLPAYGMMPPGIRGLDGGDFREQTGDLVKDMGNDPKAAEKAQALLAEGLAELGKTKEDMEDFLEVLCVDSPGSKKNAQAIQQMWAKNLDLNLIVTPMQVKMLIPKLMDGSFHSVVGGGRTANTPDASYMIDFIYHEGKWDDPVYTGFIEKSFVTVGNERIQALMDAEKYVLEQFVFIPQNFRVANSITSQSLEGFLTFPLAVQYDFKYVSKK